MPFLIFVCLIWQTLSPDSVVDDMDNTPPSPLDAIDTGELASRLEWNWLLLTPFPPDVVVFSLIAGAVILLIAWLKPSTHRHALLWTGGGIIAVTLLFWLLLVVLVFRLLSYVRQPGWQRRR